MHIKDYCIHGSHLPSEQPILFLWLYSLFHFSVCCFVCSHLRVIYLQQQENLQEKCFFFQTFSLLAILWPKKTLTNMLLKGLAISIKKCFKKKKHPRTTISINDKCIPSHLAKYKHTWKSDLFFLNTLKFQWLLFSTQDITASSVPWTMLPSSSLS